MFLIKNQIPRERLKGYPSLGVMVTMVLMGSVLFGSSSDDVEVASIRIPRDTSELSNCERNLAMSDFSNCTDFCKTLQERLTHPHQKSPWRLINTILLYLYFVTVPLSIIVCVVHIYRLKPKPTVINVNAQPLPEIVVDEQALKSGSFAPIENSCVSVTGDTPAGGEDFSLEDVAIPNAPGPSAPIRGGAAGRGGRGRGGLARGGFRGSRPETPEQKAAREHAIKMRKEQKSLARSSRFTFRGPIFMPREPEIPPPMVQPHDHIVLGDNVEFNEKCNEMYIVGSDVDDIELEPSTVVDSSTSDSMTEKKPKTKKKGNSKTTESEDKSAKAKAKSEKKEPPKKKSGENPAPQKKPSKESVPEKKPSKEGLPVKKPSKETLPEKKTSKEKENLSEKKTPEKKVSTESANGEQEEKKPEEKKKDEKKPDEEGAADE